MFLRELQKALKKENVVIKEETCEILNDKPT